MDAKVKEQIALNNGKLDKKMKAMKDALTQQI